MPLVVDWTKPPFASSTFSKVTSLTADVDSFDFDRRLFSAVLPVVSPAPPEGPAQAQAEPYEGGPTSFRCDAPAGPSQLDRQSFSSV
jgi:hypothetical protein